MNKNKYSEAVRYGTDLKVLIVGGGVAGLTLAALLLQRGFKPRVVEKVSEYKPVGYVISLWPCGARILKGLSLYEKLFDLGEVYRREVKINEKGQVLADYSYDEIIKTFGPTVGIYRSDLIDILKSKIPSHVLELGQTIQALQEKEDGVTVTFENGKKEDFDLVVGCDGIQSRVRHLVFPQQKLNYSGLYGWAFWVPPLPSLEREQFIEYYADDGRYFGVYPAKERLCAFTGVVAPENVDDSPSSCIEKIQQYFQSFGGYVPQILQELKKIETPIVPVPHYSINMDTWHTKRVVLIGDAGHAILPSMGLGASLAMESAAVLAEELTRTDSKHLDVMLAHFDKRRCPRVERIRKLSDFSFEPSESGRQTQSVIPDQYPSEEQSMGFIKNILVEPI